ncbi:MAG: glycosyltransferase family 87 protein [Hyphomonadaceae bacterium]
MPFLKVRPSRRLCLEILAVLAGLVTLGVMAWQLPTWHGLRIGAGQPVFGDFLSFWTAGRLALEGKIALVHDPHALMAAHREAIPGFTKYFPWHSPPVFLLITAPLAALPYAIAGALFLIGSLTLYIIAMRGVLPDWRALIFPLASPTAIFQLGSTQVAFAMTSFYALAARWLDRRPIAAGAAIALMAIKPHLAILWPIMLAVRGRWRTFIAAGVFTAALVALAGLVFGFESYVRFINDLGAAQELVTRRGLPPNTLTSLYANLVFLHVPHPLAIAAHGLSAAAALLLCLMVWRRDEADTSIAALTAGAMLMSPYLFFYDSMVMAVGVAALARRRLNWIEIAVFALVFSLSAICLWGARKWTLPYGPAIAWAMLLTAATRAGVVSWPRPNLKRFKRKENAAAIPA